MGCCINSQNLTSIKTVETEIVCKFSSIITSSNVKVGGIEYVANIMNHLDRSNSLGQSSEKSIFARLAEHNAELANEIRKLIFVFKDIITMDDRSVRRFVRDCDLRDLVLALRTANAEVSNKLFTNMFVRITERIRDDLEVTANVRMKNMKDAQ